MNNSGCRAGNGAMRSLAHLLKLKHVHYYKKGAHSCYNITREQFYKIALALERHHDRSFPQPSPCRENEGQAQLKEMIASALLRFQEQEE